MKRLIQRLDSASERLELIARRTLLLPVEDEQRLEQLKDLDRALDRHALALDNVQRIARRVFRENGKI